MHPPSDPAKALAGDPMPTIVFISPKGGAGKTTAALVLASQIARAAPVTVIDADPNRPIRAWGQGGHVPEGLTIVSDVDEDNIIDHIEAAAHKTPFVVVDLEGTAAKIVLLAASQADLVIIPTQGSQLDAEQASRAIKAVKDTQRMTGRAVPYTVLLTRTNPAIRTRTTTHVAHTLKDAHIPVLTTELNEREAFRAMFSFRQTLENLNPGDVSNLDKAIANADALVGEIIDLLRQSVASIQGQPEVARTA
jgi:chromosome partitioning protein